MENGYRGRKEERRRTQEATVVHKALNVAADTTSIQYTGSLKVHLKADNVKNSHDAALSFLSAHVRAESRA